MSFDFPLELEDEIFRWAICLRPYKPEDAHLALVSKRVQSIVEPMLYETVCLGNADSPGLGGLRGWTKHQRKFMVAINNRPASFFKKHVKNLYLTEIVKYPLNDWVHDAFKVFNACSGVCNLFFYQAPSHYSTVTLAFDIRSLRLPLQSIVVRSDSLSTGHPSKCQCPGGHRMEPPLPWLTHLIILLIPFHTISTFEWLSLNLKHVTFEKPEDLYGCQSEMGMEDMENILRSIEPSLATLESVTIEVSDSNLFFSNLREGGWNVDELDSKITIKQKEKLANESGRKRQRLSERRWKNRLLDYYP